MSTFGVFASGFGAAIVLSVIVGMFVDEGRHSLRVIGGYLLAAVAAPLIAVAFLLTRFGVFGSTRLDPRSLATFSRMKHEGGGRALVMAYSANLGVIFIRGVRDNTPQQKIRVRDFDEQVEDHG